VTLHNPSLRTVDHADAPHAIATAEVRSATESDGEAAGQVIYEAFREFHLSHGFAPDFPNLATAVDLATALIADPATFGVVAIRGGTVVGANFLSEGDPIRGVGPIAVHPDHQGAGIGRMLMRAVIKRGKDARGIRLVQDSFNTGTIALYTDLGFDPREPLVVLAGKPRDLPDGDGLTTVRPMAGADLLAAAALSVRVHGFDRNADVRAALARGTPVVVERAGRITGYMTMPGLWLLNHSIAESDDDLKALILGASSLTGEPLGFLFPIRRADMFRWCLGQGMRVVKPMTLMSRGPYREPGGAYLPSVFY
jgi:ribosomal protein S18 acetylase RimI-like enzyme